MSQAHLGSFNGTVTPGINMLEVFKQNELVDNPNSILNYGNMVLKKFGISCPGLGRLLKSMRKKSRSLLAFLNWE